MGGGLLYAPIVGKNGGCFMATLSDLAVQIAGDIKGRALALHTHTVADVAGLAGRLATLEQDTGWRNITANVTDATSGVLAVRRIGNTVWADFRALLGTAPTNAWYSWAGVLPAGFRPPRNWQYVAIPAWSSATTAGPLRLATNGALVIYNAKNAQGAAQTVEGLVSWVTSEAFPSTLPGTPA